MKRILQKILAVLYEYILPVINCKVNGYSTTPLLQLHNYIIILKLETHFKTIQHLTIVRELKKILADTKNEKIHYGFL